MLGMMSISLVISIYIYVRNDVDFFGIVYIYVRNDVDFFGILQLCIRIGVDFLVKDITNLWLQCPKRLAILLIYLRLEHFKENIWRRNVHQSPIHNSPSNIL